MVVIFPAPKPKRDSKEGTMTTVTIEHLYAPYKCSFLKKGSVKFGSGT